MPQGAKTHLVVPCGHVALCGGCAAHIGKSLAACPVPNPTHLNPQPWTTFTRARTEETTGEETVGKSTLQGTSRVYQGNIVQPHFHSQSVVKAIERLFVVQTTTWTCSKFYPGMAWEVSHDKGGSLPASSVFGQDFSF